MTTTYKFNAQGKLVPVDPRVEMITYFSLPSVDWKVPIDTPSFEDYCGPFKWSFSEVPWSTPSTPGARTVDSVLKMDLHVIATSIERYRRQLDRLTRKSLEEALHPRKDVAK